MMEACEQDIDQALQLFTEQPDGPGVRHPAFQLQTQKTHETEAVTNTGIQTGHPTDCADAVAPAP